MGDDETRTTGVLVLRVLSPEGTIVEGEAARVMLPGLDGDLTVLPDHHDTEVLLRTGLAHYTADHETRYLSVFGGTAGVHGDRVEVFCPVCERAEDIDHARAQEAQRRAEQRLAQKAEDLDIARAQAALARALLRMEAVELSRHT